LGLFASKKKEKQVGLEPNGLASPATDAKGLNINVTTVTVDSGGKSEGNSFEYEVLDPVEERKTEQHHRNAEL